MARKKQHAESERNKLITRRQELQEQSRHRCDKLQETLAVLNNELQKAQKKEKDYARQQIEQVMERSSRKEEWKTAATDYWKNSVFSLPNIQRSQQI